MYCWFVALGGSRVWATPYVCSDSFLFRVSWCCLVGSAALVVVVFYELISFNPPYETYGLGALSPFYYLFSHCYVFSIGYFTCTSSISLFCSDPGLSSLKVSGGAPLEHALTTSVSLLELDPGWESLWPSLGCSKSAAFLGCWSADGI